MKVVLLVDDNFDYLQLYSHYLTQTGDFAVITASGGHEAVEALKARHIDIVVSDFQMPNFGGADLLSWVLAHKPNIPFIFLSSMPEVVGVAGHKLWLQKPMLPRDVIHSLKRVKEILNR